MKKTPIGESFGTGDINLAAAVMTMGVPPERHIVKLIASTDGKDYVRFLLRDVSIDGTLKTSALMDSWSDSANHIKTYPTCSFGKIMSFILARPADCKSYIEWCEYACSWLEISMNQCRQMMIKSPKVWETSPDSEPAYILGFIANRFYLLDMANRFRKDGNFDIYAEYGKASALISERLPSNMRQFLLSQLK